MSDSATRILKRCFYLRPVQQVARDLLGQKLMRSIDDRLTGGIITETEAYDGESDLACHARSGKTERNKIMYTAGGHAYVYFTYGLHWLLNCVTGESGYPAAVLIRAILPTNGLETIGQRRAGISQSHWCDGPAKLTRALSIDGSCNGADLCSTDSGLYIEGGMNFPDNLVTTSPRVGIQYAPEPWRSLPWRFCAALDAKDISQLPVE